MEKTDWFDGNVKPVRVGVYERDFGKSGKNIGYAKWSGKHWYWRAGTPKAAQNKTNRSAHTNIPLRGLASDPKVKK